MNKNYLWWLVGAVAVVLAVYLILSLPGMDYGAEPETNNVPVGNTVPAGGAVSGEVIETPATEPNPLLNRTPEPIATPEFMTVEEKKALNIDEASKVQVLQRFEDGTIGAYKVINADSDIVTSF